MVEPFVEMFLPLMGLLLWTRGATTDKDKAEEDPPDNGEVEEDLGGPGIWPFTLDLST